MENLADEATTSASIAVKDRPLMIRLRSSSVCLRPGGAITRDLINMNPQKSNREKSRNRRSTRRYHSSPPMLRVNVSIMGG